MPQQDWFSQFEAKPQPPMAPMPAHAQSTTTGDWFSQFDPPKPLSQQERTDKVVNDSLMGPIRWAKDNPGTVGAMAAGLAVAPFTGGMSLGGMMLAEAGAAGAGTVAGNLVGGKPQDSQETLVNATFGAGGPPLTGGARVALNSARAIVGAVRGMPEAAKQAIARKVVDLIVDELPVIGTARRVGRAASEGADLIAEVTPGFNRVADARGAAALKPDKYAARAESAVAPEQAAPSRGIGGEGLTPEQQAAERAFKQRLVEARDRARMTPEPAHTPAAPAAAPTPRPSTSIGPRNYFLRKPDSEPSFMGYGNPPESAPVAAKPDAAAAFAERFGVSADDAVRRILDSPELKSVSKAKQIAIIVGDKTLSAETKRLAIEYIQRNSPTR